MSTGAYIGDSNNKAKKIVAIYIGDSQNKAKRVVKGYIGDSNNKAKLWWNPSSGDYWKFYETRAVKFLEAKYSFEGNKQEYTKANNGIAYFAIIAVWIRLYAYYFPILLSTDSSAVDLSGKTNLFSGNLTMNNDTWYYAIPSYDAPLKYSNVDNEFTPKCILNTQQYTLSQQDNSQPAKDLLDKIYSNCFAKDYKTGGTYDLAVADVEKSAKKIFGIFLFRKHVLKGNTDYDTFLLNIETIISMIKERCTRGNYNKIAILISVGAHSSDTTKWISLNIYFSNNSTNSKRITSQTSRNGFNYFDFTPAVKGQYVLSLRFDNNGMSTQSDTSFNFDITTFGYNTGTDSINSQVYGSNIGLDLGSE